MKAKTILGVTFPSLALVLAGLFVSRSASAQNTFNWTGTSSTDTNWSDGFNWDVNTSGVYPGTDGTGDIVIFGSVATTNSSTAINNVVDTTTTLTSLTYNQTANAAWHVTQIPANNVLTVGAFTVGGATDGNGESTDVAFTGSGTLFVNGSFLAGNQGGSAINTNTILDLSGLNNFTYNNSSGTFVLGANGGNSRTSANMKFAAVSNNITASSLYLSQYNTSSSASATTSQVLLGAGTNILNAATIGAGYNRTASTIKFAGATGGLRIRGLDGTDNTLATLYLGWLDYNGGSSGFTTASTISLFGHPVDIKLGTLYLGRNTDNGFSGSATAYATCQGTLSFDSGTVYATSIILGQTSVGARNYIAATGTINVSTNGNLVVGSGGITMVGASSTYSTTNLAALNLTNATLTCSNNITKTAGASGGTYTAKISLIRSTLNMTNGVVGTPVPIDSMTIGDSSLTLAIPLNATNIVANAFNNASSTSNTINIVAFPTIAHYPTTYTLLACSSGTIGAFGLGTLPTASPAYKGYLTTTANTVQFVLTNGPAPAVQTLVWNGNVSGDWDMLTANWQGGLFYNQGDYPTFNDSLSGNTNVNLTTALLPGTLTVSNNIKLYIFGGSGSISNITSGGLVKYGTNTLVFANSGNNTFSGGISINAGKVQLSNYDDILPTNGTVSLGNTSSAILDLNNRNQSIGALAGGGTAGGNVTLGLSGTNTLTIIRNGGAFSGTISGNGAVALSSGGGATFYGANTYTNGTTLYASSTLVLANTNGSGTGPGPVTINSGGTLQIGDLLSAGSVAAPSIQNDGAIVFNATNNVFFTNQLAGGGNIFQNGNNTVTMTYPNINFFGGSVTINSGALLATDSNALGLLTPITVNQGLTTSLQLAGGINLANSVTVVGKAGTIPSLLNVSGSNVISGNITLSGNGNNFIFDAAAGTFLLSGTGDTGPGASKYIVWMTGSGNGEWDGTLSSGSMLKDGAGTWTLGGNTYNFSGATAISNGTLVVRGVIANSPVTVYGGTLAGNGMFAQPVVVSTNGTLSPGVNSIDTMTMSSDLTLAGSANMDLDGPSVTSDLVSVGGTLTEGGALNVILTGPVAAGDSFTLFTAGAFAGSFSATNLPVLTGGLAWDTSNLGNGILAVVSNGNPTLNSKQAGNVLTFSWSGAFNLQSQTNALSTGLKSNWFNYPGGGSSPVSVTIDPNAPSVYFRLSQ